MMPILLFVIAGALIGHGLEGSLGAGVGLLLGAFVGVALAVWMDY